MSGLCKLVPACSPLSVAHTATNSKSPFCVSTALWWHCMGRLSWADLHRQDNCLGHIQSPITDSIACRTCQCVFVWLANGYLWLMQWVWQKLPHVKERRTKDLLINVMSTALYYNASLAVTFLQQQQQLPAFLTSWAKVISSSAIMAASNQHICRLNVVRPFLLQHCSSKRYICRLDVTRSTMTDAFGLHNLLTLCIQKCTHLHCYLAIALNLPVIGVLTLLLLLLLLQRVVSSHKTPSCNTSCVHSLQAHMHNNRTSSRVWLQPVQAH